MSDLYSGRQHLREKIHLLENLRGSECSREVNIVPKDWHMRLIYWIKDDAAPFPGTIDNTPLLCDGVFDGTKKWQIDFMVVETEIWPKLMHMFHCSCPITRRLTTHPTTGVTEVLINPIILELWFQNTGRRKTCNGTWKLGDVRRILCSVLQVVVTDYCFVTYSAGVPVDDEMLIGDYVSQYGVKVRMNRRVMTRVSNQYRDILSSQRMEKLPLLTVATEPKAGSSIVVKLPRPIGLMNLGNSCYFNAPLQCLIRIRPLINFVMSPSYPILINKTNPNGSGGAIATNFRELMESMISGKSNRPRDPRALRHAISRRYRQFASTEQYDAHEMLLSIIDGLHEDFNTLHTGDNGMTPRSRKLQEENPTKPMSFIGDLFYGVLITSIQCPDCGHAQNLYDHFLCLSLPIPRRQSSKSVTLNECLSAFLNANMDDNTLWKCQSCNHMVQATTKASIHIAPTILIIHFQRFDNSQQRLKKIHDQVVYGDHLEIRTFSGTTETYQLIGVVNHSGSLFCGHYNSSAIDPATGKWFFFNDSVVSPASPVVVHSDNAYLLFYQKIN